MGNAAAVVADVGGERRLISLDKGHWLEIRPAGGQSTVIETRPVTEFSAAVGADGRLHIAAWLLSRHLMYYSSADGVAFTRITLLKGEGSLKLRDVLMCAGDDVLVAYVAETEDADTLVCYRKNGGDWDGRRIVEVARPQRLTAYQFDGLPGAAAIVYGVREQGRTVVLSRPVSGQDMQDVIATVAGGLTDFCSLTTGGVRQACWISDGHVAVNGVRQSEEAGTRSWPVLRRAENGVQCLWVEDGSLKGVALGGQRARLRGVPLRDAILGHLALPGELRRAVVDSRKYQEVALQAEAPERPAHGARPGPQPNSPPPAGRGGQGDAPLADVVRNQAVYLTRMQESLSAMERNVLRLQSEVNRLSREVAAVLRARESQAKPAPQRAMTPEGRPMTAAGWKAEDFLPPQDEPCASVPAPVSAEPAPPQAADGRSAEGEDEPYSGA